MNNERRINIRVSAELFDALDAKRFHDRTSWQDIGVSLLTQWLGSKAVRKTVATNRLDATYGNLFKEPENKRLLDQIATVLQSGAQDAIRAITENLNVFAKYSKYSKEA